MLLASLTLSAPANEVSRATPSRSDWCPAVVQASSIRTVRPLRPWSDVFRCLGLQWRQRGVGGALLRRGGTVTIGPAVASIPEPTSAITSLTGAALLAAYGVLRLRRFQAAAGLRRRPAAGPDAAEPVGYRIDRGGQDAAGSRDHWGQFEPVPWPSGSNVILGDILRTEMVALSIREETFIDVNLNRIGVVQHESVVADPAIRRRDDSSVFGVHHQGMLAPQSVGREGITEGDPHRPHHAGHHAGGR